MFLQFDRSVAGKIALAVGVGVGTLLVYRKWKQYQQPKWIDVGVVSELWIYPVKSCKGRSVSEAECERLGLKHGHCSDRRFVIADQTGKFLTAREEPRLVLVDVVWDENALTLSAPGKEPVRGNLDEIVKNGKVERIRLWEDMPIDAYDCGPEIANWIDDYIGKPDGAQRCRLFYHLPGMFNSRSLDNWKKLDGLFGKRKDLSVFTDLAPYLLMTEASMDDVNERVPSGEQFSVRSFRPNFIVTGTKPFDEDKWAKIRIGEETEFLNIKHCTRCLLTTINYTTGEKHPRQEPLRTLRSYRITQDPKEKKYYGATPMLGINLVIDKLGSVRVGDHVYVTYKK